MLPCYKAIRHLLVLVCSLRQSSGHEGGELDFSFRRRTVAGGLWPPTLKRVLQQFVHARDPSGASLSPNVCYSLNRVEQLPRTFVQKGSSWRRVSSLRCRRD